MEDETTFQDPWIDLKAIWQTLTEQAFLFGPQILFAIIILVVDNWVARLLSNLARRTLENRKLEPLLVDFSGRLFTHLLSPL